MPWGLVRIGPALAAVTELGGGQEAPALHLPQVQHTRRAAGTWCNATRYSTAAGANRREEDEPLSDLRPRRSRHLKLPLQQLLRHLLP